MKHHWTITAVFVFLAAMLCSGITRADTAPTLLLLIPDDANLADSQVNLWLDAANEEGLLITPIHDSEFVHHSFETLACTGLILPDSIHKQASDALIATIHRFVSRGGKLMLVYDAGTLSPEGRYAPGRSRLSDLAGVDYALYDSLRDKTTAWGNVAGPNSTFRELAIPPGKYYPFEADTAALTSPAPESESFESQLRRYSFGDIQYPSFVTDANYAGHTLFHSGATIVAGEHRYQKGSVLFVNLPLTYLKSRTDGLLLHAFLKYFAEHMLSLPYLMSVPDGIGGLVLNWHIDSNVAIRPLQELLSWTPLQDQGPYSIHITAGPDARAFGDHLGFDAEHNPQSSELVRRYSKLGNQIGSHGGWIHDYYATHADAGNHAEIEPLLQLNKDALERVTGKPVVEYSAPSGNQPPWVTQWLDAHGFVAYYFTGNTGMGPTQGYRDGVRESQNMWEFPILHLDRAAAFEEMKPEGYSDEQVEHWLDAVAEFAANQRCVRLVYFHPPGILPYKQVVMNWLGLTARLRADGRFRWYTMTELANFLNSRKQVDWKFSEERELITLDATHPQTLEHQTWFFPAARFTKPKVIRGSATVKDEADGWTVIAGNVGALEIRAEVLGK
jgi:hypothetical protein